MWSSAPAAAQAAAASSGQEQVLLAAQAPVDHPLARLRPGRQLGQHGQHRRQPGPGRGEHHVARVLLRPAEEPVGAGHVDLGAQRQAHEVLGRRTARHDRTMKRSACPWSLREAMEKLRRMSRPAWSRPTASDTNCPARNGSAGGSTRSNTRSTTPRAMVVWRGQAGAKRLGQGLGHEAARYTALRPDSQGSSRLDPCSVLLFPALGADQRHERHPAQIGGLVLHARPAIDAHQALVVGDVRPPG